ncbi:MAG: hypothetical protein ABIL22_04340, partial [candidate division WOR-3 bacterium]
FFALADESKKLGIPFAGHIPWSVSTIEASDAGQKCFEHLGAAVSPRIVWDCSSMKDKLRKEGEDVFDGISIQAPLTPAQREALRSFPRKILETYDAREADALFARLARNNTWLCPTITVLRSMRSLYDENFTRDPRLKYMRRNIKENWAAKNNPFICRWTKEYQALEKRVYQKEMEVTGAMRRAGVEILAGSDEPNPFCFPGFSLHDELGLLVQSGLT